MHSLFRFLSLCLLLGLTALKPAHADWAIDRYIINFGGYNEMHTLVNGHEVVSQTPNIGNNRGPFSSNVEEVSAANLAPGWLQGSGSLGYMGNGMAAGHATVDYSFTPVFKWIGGGTPSSKIYYREYCEVSVARYAFKQYDNYTDASPYTGDGFTFSISNPWKESSEDWGHVDPYNGVQYAPWMQIDGVHSWHVNVLKATGSETRGPARRYSAKANSSGGWNDTNASANIFVGYQAELANVSISATPLGPYTLLKNEPQDKEFKGLTRWTSEIQNDGILYDETVHNDMDPDTVLKALHVAPTIGAESSFLATAKTASGGDLLSNQKYLWAVSPTTFKPVNGIFTVDTQPDILQWKYIRNGEAHYFNIFVNRLAQSAVDSQTFGLGGQYVPDLHAGTVFVSPLRDELLRQLEFGWRNAFPDPTTQVDTSTASKTFSWNFGEDYNHFSQTSNVKVQVTSDDPGSPIINVGRVKIKWSRPKKSVFHVKIYQTTWHVPEGAGFIDAVRSTFTSNESLNSKINLWAGLQVANAVVMVATGGAGEAVAGPSTIELTTVGEASAAGIADEVAATATEQAAMSVMADESIPVGAQGKFRIEVEPPPPEEGEVAEATITREGTVTKGAGCFVAGTPVLMADGTQKPIELVQVGDKVLSKDEKTGELASKAVTHLSVKQHIATLRLTFGDGSVVETTDLHPFYVQDRGFVKAGELGVGNSIVTRAGPSLSIAKIERNAQVTTVYNFTVEDFHTYFVGKNAFWVHNANFCSQVLLDKHFFDHGAEFGATTAEQYEQLASNFMTGTQSTTTMQGIRSNGEIVRYDTLTGEFGIISPNGEIVTYFKPNPAQHKFNDNITYFMHECDQ